MQNIIESNNHDIQTIPIDKAANLQDFDKIVIGASIRYGKHNQEVYKFIEKYQTVLDQKSNAFFQ